MLYTLQVPAQVQNLNPISLVDQDATRKTKALYAQLKNISKTNILFGHQDALAYGVHWKNWHKRRSDVHDVCGKHPALVGWELSKLGKFSHNIDTVDFQHMKGWIKEVYRMGGINEISWHMDKAVLGHGYAKAPIIAACYDLLGKSCELPVWML